MSMHELLSEIGKRVRKLRKNKELTQAQLAKKAKVDQKTISNLETGTLRNAPRLDIVGAIAEALDLELWQLLMPEPVQDLPKDHVHKLILNYAKASSEGQATIARIAKIEANETHTS